MTVSADDLVRREVHYCVSYLVSTLAKSAGGMLASRSGGNPYLDDHIRDTCHLADQALELASPVDDWEEAAREYGWITADLTPGMLILEIDGPVAQSTMGGWQSACDLSDIEPYQREVFEHWIVSDWLADKLAEKGEKVDKDFAGMIVWARTTTGQGIASDSVIEAIAADLAAAA